MLIGQTFLIPHPKTLNKHLYVVISHADNDDDRVLIVNVTTFRDDQTQEKCCELDKGDHPFIKHKSIINYEDALDPQVCKIQQNLADGLIEQYDDVTAEVLLKIQKGARSSEALPKKMQVYFNKF